MLIFPNMHENKSVIILHFFPLRAHLECTCAFRNIAIPLPSFPTPLFLTATVLSLVSPSMTTVPPPPHGFTELEFQGVEVSSSLLGTEGLGHLNV